MTDPIKPAPTHITPKLTEEQFNFVTQAFVGAVSGSGDPTKWGPGLGVLQAFEAAGKEYQEAKNEHAQAVAKAGRLALGLDKPEAAPAAAAEADAAAAAAAAAGPAQSASA
jgi:hypothetical protein